MKPLKAPGPSKWRVVDKTIDGVTRTLLTVGALSSALNRPVATLRVWERQGLLPKTPYRNDNGERLYTIEQLHELRKRAVHDPTLANIVRRGVRTDEVVRKVRYADDREEETVLYRVRILAKEIDRTPQTIRLMERKKGLPPTPLRSGSQRLYTLGMIRAVKEACLGKRHAWVWQEIYMRVLLAWQELGVLGAMVVDEEGSCEGTVSGSGGLREGG